MKTFSLKEITDNTKRERYRHLMQTIRSMEIERRLIALQYGVFRSLVPDDSHHYTLMFSDLCNVILAVLKSGNTTSSTLDKNLFFIRDIQNILSKVGFDRFYEGEIIQRRDIQKALDHLMEKGMIENDVDVFGDMRYKFSVN